MKVWLRNIWETISGSLWALPTAIIAVALALGVGAVWVEDYSANSEFLDKLGFLYRSGADNSLAILTIIGTSVMTVAGVSFSITIVSLTLASSQFGPRLLRNFMRSFASQAILGTFMGTFVYCLVIMRSVGTVWDEGSPHVSITIAVLLAILCVCLLIYYVHHVASSIQADNLVADVYRELESAIESLSPLEKTGAGTAKEEARTHSPSASLIAAPRSGYLLAIDADKLAVWAKAEGYLIGLVYRPGSFIAKGEEIAWIEGAASGVDVGQLRKKLLESVYIGRQRSREQDIEYIISQLVEIAVRALSPSINDPKTAEVCVDYLAAALCRAADRQLLNQSRWNDDGQPLLLVPSTDFAGIVDESFNRIRQSFENQPSVIIRVLNALTRVVRFVLAYPDRREAVIDQVRQIEQILPRLSLTNKDSQDLEDRLRSFHTLVEKT